MAGRSTARHVDADPGWVTRRFRELEAKINALQVGKLSAVPGSTVTIQQILTDPAGVVKFINTDSATATADDASVTIPLSQLPIMGSVHVRQNGVSLAASEWERVAQTIVVAATADLVIREDDVFTTAYAYDGTSTLPPAVDIEALGYDSDIDSWPIPSEAVPGCLLVAVAMAPAAAGINDNGWSTPGESDPVTHAAYTGTYTYKLVVRATVWDGTATVPTINIGFGQSVCLMIAFDGGTNVDALFDTAATGSTASTPATSPSSLRVWATVASMVTITPSQGTTVGTIGGDDIDIIMTLDDDTGAVSASTGGDAGWCLASLVVR